MGVVLKRFRAKQHVLGQLFQSCEEKSRWLIKSSIISVLLYFSVLKYKK